MSDYYDEARSDARSTCLEYVDEIVEQLEGAKGQASDDLLNDYANGDYWHHEHNVVNLTLVEAAELLDELVRDCETDRGLWEGLEPRQAVIVQAAYTYQNTVMRLWQGCIKSINKDADIQEILDERDSLDEDDESIDALKAEITDRLKECVEEIIVEELG